MSSSTSTSTSSSKNKIDVKHRTRGVWLVKVPKYLSQRWQQQAGMGEVGRLKVNKSPKVDVTFHLNPTAAAAHTAADGSNLIKVPEEHKFITQTLNHQTLAIISEDKTDVDEPEMESGKLIIEGRSYKKPNVVRRRAIII